MMKREMTKFVVVVVIVVVVEWVKRRLRPLKAKYFDLMMMMRMMMN